MLFRDTKINSNKNQPKKVVAKVKQEMGKEKQDYCFSEVL